MTRNQFIAYIAAIPFIGKLFKSKIQSEPVPTGYVVSFADTQGDGLGYPSAYPTYEKFESYVELKSDNLFYTFYEGPVKPIIYMQSSDGGRTWKEVEFCEPFIFKT